METVKLFFKRVLPSSIKNIIIKYKNRPIFNYFKTKYDKKALLSYIVYPFRETSLRHTNYYEAIRWANTLNELGYQVDIINFDNYPQRLELSQYDLICGFGDVFQAYFESGIRKKIITIYYGTGMHVCHQNSISLARIRDVYNKKGVWLGKSARFVEKTWSHQTILVDGIIALGNNVCAESYKKYYDGKILSLPALFYQTQDPYKILNSKAKNSNKNFLWFGSSGLIHKGLDLLLEFFSNNSGLTLHICGPINKEPDFLKAYQKELFNTKNIVVHGFIDISGIKFKNILQKCAFVIFPSCSEGGSPGVLTAIGNGGLIPIVSKNATISTGYEILIETLDNKGIEDAVGEATRLSQDAINELAQKNLYYVLQNNSKEKYKSNLKSAIMEILKNNL